MAKTIASLGTLSTVDDTCYFVVHNGSGDFKVSYPEMMKTNSNGQANNCRLRGKSLGTVTASNIDTFIATYGIEDGTFTNIYPGDYFTISYPVPTTDSDGNTTIVATNKDIRVLGLNTFKYTGDTSFTSNHIVCAPNNAFYSAAMNSTNTTGVSENSENSSTYGAYYGSDMHQIEIPKIDAALGDIFGSHLLSRRELLATAMDENATPAGNSSWTGASSSWAWQDVQSVLMSEMNVYGGTVWDSSGYDTGIARQMPLYKLDPYYINYVRWGIWLRGVASGSFFCYCNLIGSATSYTATSVAGVRPCFCLG